MTYPYDFEFQQVHPAVCTRCGALVQNRTVHEDWHDSLFTPGQLAEALSVRRCYKGNDA